MKLIHAIAAAALALALAGCAGDVAAPVAVQSLPEDQLTNLHISDVAADAESGVPMSDSDLGLICQKVRSYMQNEAPGVMVDETSNSTLKMRPSFGPFIAITKPS